MIATETQSQLEGAAQGAGVRAVDGHTVGAGTTGAAGKTVGNEATSATSATETDGINRIDVPSPSPATSGRAETGATDDHSMNPASNDNARRIDLADHKPHPTSQTGSPIGSPPDADSDEQHPGTGRRKRWARRLGVVGFLFFFIKGLVWLGLAAAAGIGIMNAS